jgi:tetratricopeptide (TPR) repeat protein
MRAFLSHSSVDKGIVVAVHDALEKESTWLDRAEIEWGSLFLEKIADGIKSATDFVLFWSGAAAKSEWVRLEINMAFIQALRHKAIRLRVVLLDRTPLPPYLEPYQSFSVIGLPDPAKDIVGKLSPLLREPIRSARAKFVNRNGEIASIESAIDNPEVAAAWLFGFTGIGKNSLVGEATRRLFEGADPVRVEINPGTGFVELALKLNAARKVALAESLSEEEVERQIRLSAETIAKEGRILCLFNVQHWLNEDGEPTGPLLLLLEIAKSVPDFCRRPVFFTSTRRPRLDPEQLKRLDLIHVGGLSEEHTSVLVRNWYFAIYGKDIAPEDATTIAPKLFGHPIAARLVAGLLGQHSAQYLEQYPREMVALRRDLARFLLRELRLSPLSEKLMETLALAGIALPGKVVAAVGFSDDEFQAAVEECARAGLVTADIMLEGHPLFQEFFWHKLHRSDYQGKAGKLAQVLRDHLKSLEKDSLEYVDFLPVAYRLFAMAGDLQSATALRSDLLGELEATALILYNRRNYALADKYIGHILDVDPKNWRMRLYRARVRVREENWVEADAILDAMLRERDGDIGAMHAKGWLRLRRKRLKEALEIFARVIARREHVASLRDAAECLHRLKRNDEALEFLKRAKARESENPFVLDLESRILEEKGELEPAFESALLASARDPLNGHLHHRLGQIRNKQGRPELAIPHFEKSIEIDSDQFSPANSLAAAYLETGRVDDAEEIFGSLVKKARTPGDHALVEHIKARLAFCNGDLVESEKILRREIDQSRNVIHNLGFLANVELVLFDQNVGSYQATAQVALAAAEDAVKKLEELDPDNQFIEKLRSGIQDRRRKARW